MGFWLSHIMKEEQAELVDPIELEKIKSDADDQKSAVDVQYEKKRVPVEKETRLVISKRRRRSRLQILAYQEKAFRGICTSPAVFSYPIFLPRIEMRGFREIPGLCL